MVKSTPPNGDPSGLLPRHLAASIREALEDTPGVLVIGPRQGGKTTLCESIAADRGARFLTLDDGASLAAAAADPDGFARSLSGPVVIDEVQRVPDLLRSLKLVIDRKRESGRFLLTGSANVLTLPRVSESLAGRIEVVTLWTLSQGELGRRREGFVDALFGGPPPLSGKEGESRAGILRRALTGGFPELRKRLRPERRGAWFGAYLTTLVQRDVRDVAEVENAWAMPRLLGLIASRAGQILNIADLSRGLGMPHSTVTRYLAVLEALFVVRTVPAWTVSSRSRLLKAPRVIFSDSGLLAHVAGWDEERLDRDANATGALLENFVAMEIQRQLGWSRTRAVLHHFRTYAGREVDLVLETPDRRVVGVEVKSGLVGPSDFRGLRALAELAGKRFHRGVVLYAGRETVPFGDRLWAVPLSGLWEWGATSPLAGGAAG